MKAQIINNALTTENFSKDYPILNKFLYENADFEESRNGGTKEVLDFKTTLTNPYKRLVGNNERDINVFFLLAEAMWIVRGRKDVEFLEIFNTRMKDYSDDGVSFHAPYGFRLRHYGVSSFDTVKATEGNQRHGVGQLNTGHDQLIDALKELKANPQTRQVVMAIWNPDLDLAKKTKDIPCNDLIMLKIRKGELVTTIANRSNDLHWGLPTNIFQFSFLGEVIASILDISLGSQTHNSQSLHFYLDNPIADKMYENLQLSNGEYVDLYDISKPMFMDIAFAEKTVEKRLREVDYHIDSIINAILKNIPLGDEAELELKAFSNYFWFAYKLLWIYAEYKNDARTKDDALRLEYYNRIKVEYSWFKGTDIYTLALNFFASRIKNRTDQSVIGKL